MMASNGVITRSKSKVVTQPTPAPPQAANAPAPEPPKEPEIIEVVPPDAAPPIAILVFDASFLLEPGRRYLRSHSPRVFLESLSLHLGDNSTGPIYSRLPGFKAVVDVGHRGHLEIIVERGSEAHRHLSAPHYRVPWKNGFFFSPMEVRTHRHGVKVPGLPNHFAFSQLPVTFSASDIQRVMHSQGHRIGQVKFYFADAEMQIKNGCAYAFGTAADGTRGFRIVRDKTRPADSLHVHISHARKF